MLNFSSSAFVLASLTYCDRKEKDARAGTLFMKLSRADSLLFSELVRERLLIRPRELDLARPDRAEFSGNEYSSDCIFDFFCRN